MAYKDLLLAERSRADAAERRMRDMERERNMRKQPGLLTRISRWKWRNGYEIPEWPFWVLFGLTLFFVPAVWCYADICKGNFVGKIADAQCSMACKEVAEGEYLSMPVYINVEKKKYEMKGNYLRCRCLLKSTPAIYEVYRQPYVWAPFSQE